MSLPRRPTIVFDTDLQAGCVFTSGYYVNQVEVCVGALNSAGFETIISLGGLTRMDIGPHADSPDLSRFLLAWCLVAPIGARVTLPSGRTGVVERRLLGVLQLVDARSGRRFLFEPSAAATANRRSVTYRIEHPPIFPAGGSASSTPRDASESPAGTPASVESAHPDAPADRLEAPCVGGAAGLPAPLTPGINTAREEAQP